MIRLYALSLAAGLAFSAAVQVAHSHSFYDAACCHDRDCYPIDNPRVDVRPDGYFVTLSPGDHPLVTRTVTRLFRFSDMDPGNNNVEPREARQSQDENFHACMVGGVIFCLYAPLQGY